MGPHGMGNKIETSERFRSLPYVCHIKFFIIQHSVSLDPGFSISIVCLLKKPVRGVRFLELNSVNLAEVDRAEIELNTVQYSVASRQGYKYAKSHVLLAWIAQFSILFLAIIAATLVATST
jgi:hypothetical protein